MSEHHLDRINSSASVGARVVERMWGGPLWSPVWGMLTSHRRRTTAGDHKGPPFPAPPPSPLRNPGLEFRFMPIGRYWARPWIQRWVFALALLFAVAFLLFPLTASAHAI